MGRYMRWALGMVITCGLCLGAAAQGGNPPPAAAAADMYLAIVADNTGLSKADWEVQKRGYLEFLTQDRLTADGVTAVSLIQYVTVNGGQYAHVTMPATAIDGGINNIRRVLKKAPLLTAQAPGSTAIETVLEEFGDNAATSNVCMTTTTDWSAQLIEQGNAALTQAGVQRFSILVADVSGSSAHFSTGARKMPTPTLFSGFAKGDGIAFGARSLGQMVSVLDSVCLMPAVRLEAIEVNQVIQDWENDVPLVQYKPTIVRVFLESVLSPSATASGVLHGTRGGVALSNSPLSPIIDTITVDSDVANSTDRKDFESSLNFTLPTSWLQGDVELRFEATAMLACGSAPPAARDCAVDVEFIEADEPEISYVTVPYSVGSTDFEPTSAELVEQMYRTMDTFPIRYVDMGFEFLPSWGEGMPPLGDTDETEYATDVLDTLTWLRVLDHVFEDPLAPWWDSEERWYGVLEGSCGGLAYTPGVVGGGCLSGDGGVEDYGYARNRGPHEIAHNYGAHHVTNEAENGTNDSGSVLGWCGETGSSSAPDFPYWSTLSGTVYPNLGHLGDTDDEIWGLAPRFEGDNENLLVSSPYDVFPLMSYCTALDSTSQWRWPDQQTYEVLTEEFLGTGFERSADVVERAKPRPGVLIRGILVDEDPHILSFRPALPVPTDLYPDIQGDWQAQLVDASGKVLSTREFQTGETEVGDPAGVDGPDVVSTGWPFSILFPQAAVGKAKEVRIYHEVDGSTPELVGALTRSAKAPRVTIDPVRPGQQGDTVRVRWRAQDLDGDPLLTTVQYRTSPKEQWQTVALDVEADAVDIPSLALSGSRTGQFRVVTSDGLSFAQAISPVVALPDHDIEPGFFGLVGDAESFPLVGAQNLTLEAFAYDIEDGNISDKITWRLGRKTLVGDGESFPIFADSLPEGSHLGTLSVTDSAGHTKTTQFKVIVYRVKDWGSQQG